MFKKFVILGMLLLCSAESFSQTEEEEEIAPSYCSQSLNTLGITSIAAPLVLYMLYHRALPRSADLPIIGKRTNTKTHIATFLLTLSEIFILAMQYPSKTFDISASFMTPILVFGTYLNFNKLLNRPISQSTAVKTGRMALGVLSLGIVPAVWLGHYWTCSESSE